MTEYNYHYTHHYSYKYCYISSSSCLIVVTISLTDRQTERWSEDLLAQLIQGVGHLHHYLGGGQLLSGVALSLLRFNLVTTQQYNCYYSHIQTEI